MFEEMPEPSEGPPDDAMATPDPSPTERPTGPSGANAASESDPPQHEPVPEFDPLNGLQQAQAALQRAEAARLVALLDGYAAAMADTRAAFGPRSDDPDGPFARSFLLEAAQVLRMSERGAAHLLNTAESLQNAYPATWRTFRDGRTTWQAVELVWRQAQGLDPELLPAYDAAAAGMVEATPVPRLKDRLHRLRESLQPDTAARRRRAAEGDRRMELEPAADGMAYWTFYGPAPELIAADEAVTRMATAAHGADGEERCIPALRYDIALDLVLEGMKQPAQPGSDVRVPQRKGVQPVVYVTVPVLTALGKGGEPATLAGYGPIDIDTARDLLARAPSLIRILTDPVTGVRLAMDRQAYTPPPDLKRWLRVRDETCRAPGCRRAAHLCDLDHVIPWQPDGRTEERNLAHLCRRHHRLKGSGYWHTELDDHGRMLWVSPWGRRYVTEPADGSTTTVTPPPPACEDAAPFDLPDAA